MTVVVDKPVSGEFQEALAGYSMVFTCEHADGCDLEVEWYGNQHGCHEGHFCDRHMREFFDQVRVDLYVTGAVGCPLCQRAFYSWDDFVWARRI